jgi:hypothetical protein
VNLGTGELYEVARVELDLEPPAAAVDEDRRVLERRRVEMRRQLPALPERARAAADVAGGALRLPLVGMRARLPRRFRSSCALTGTQATASTPSTETTSVLKSR